MPATECGSIKKIVKTGHINCYFNKLVPVVLVTFVT